MRGRLVRGLVAICAAVTITVVGGTARPAQAAVPWGSIVIQVASLLFGGGGGGDDLERAKQEIIAAINTSRQEILDHIDSIASADVRACAQAGTTLVNQIDLMDPFTLASFVVSAVECTGKASAYFDAVQNLAAADNIGLLLGTIYSIAMVGFAKLNFPPVDLLDNLIRSYEAVLNKIVVRSTVSGHTWSDPECTWYTENTYHFFAPNGDRIDWGVEYWCGSQVINPCPWDQLAREVMRNTSRPIAEEALPRLRELRAGLP